MLFSGRSLFKLGLPIFLQSIFSVTIAMVDSVMVGEIGETAVSGVSLIGAVDNMLTTFFLALTIGGTVVMSQYLGANKDARASEASKQLIYLATGLAMLMSLIGLFLRGPMLRLFFGEVEAAVMENAQTYFFFMALSYPFMALSESCSAALRAMGDSASTLAVSIVSNLINVGGNALTIYGLHWGVAGAGASSLFARVMAAVIMLCVLLKKQGRIRPQRLLRYRPDKQIVVDILRIGGSHAIGNSMFHIGRLLTQSMVSTLGTVAITANSVALNIASYQYMISNTIGSVAMIAVGRCVGAGEKKQAKSCAWRLLAAAYVGMWIVVAISIVFAEPIIGMWQVEGDTMALAKELIVFHSISTAIIYPMSFVLPGIFRAASDVKLQMWITIIGMWIFRVLLAYLLLTWDIPLFGVPAGIMSVWMAMVIDWVFRAAVFLPRYLSGRWLTVYDKLQKKVEA